MTEKDNYSGLISESLVVSWPGVKPPTLQLIESKDCNIKIGWQEPKITGNAKISFYRVIAHCEQTDRVITQGPIEPSILECQLNSLDYGRHKIQVEINVYGFTEPFMSAPMYLDLGSQPEAPLLVVSLPALDGRIKLDSIACKLINKRDR